MQRTFLRTCSCLVAIHAVLACGGSGKQLAGPSSPEPSGASGPSAPTAPTPDTTAPTLVSTTPSLEGTLQIDTLGSLQLTFSENVTVDASKVTLLRGGDSITASVVAAGASVTVSPTTNWTSGDYTLTVAVDAVSDLANNRLATAFSANFTVADTLPPTLSRVFPSTASGIGPVDTLKLRFNEPVIGATVLTAAVTRNGVPIAGTSQLLEGEVLTITLPARAPIRSTYVVSIPAGVRDTDNNATTAALTVEWQTTTAHVGFITSVTGTGNLSTWSGASGSGLAAADSVCQNRANNAGLTGTFVAYLSDDTSDAYCRIHGRTGKKSANCGQSTLPASAGPWVTPNGTALLDLSGINGGYMQGSLLDREDGSLATNNGVYTGTDDGGVLSGSSPCGNWTSAGMTIVATGLIGFGSNLGGATRGCQEGDALLCLQTGAGEAAPTAAVISPNRPKLVFVSSEVGNGNLSTWSNLGGATGIAAAHQVCRNKAAAAGLSNSTNFRAWLSSATEDANEGLLGEGPWVRPDGSLVALDRDGWFNDVHLAALSQNESGTYVFTNVWTGSTSLGAATANHCTSWTSTSGNGTRGRAVASGDQWTDKNTSPCSSNAALYCYEE